ncbi:MAG: flagellin [Succinivibrionaceae bacterium]
MSLYVNTNVSSLNAQRQLSNSTRSLDVSYQRLASGLRINSAKDDAAGLQISDRMTSQINGLNQGNRNAQDGISYCQTAEGAMDEITNMLQRIRTLSIQSANGTNSNKDREAIQQEVTQLCTEIDRIASDTTYAGGNILNGERKIQLDSNDKTIKTTETTTSSSNNKTINFQVGADANQTISVSLGFDATIKDTQATPQDQKFKVGFSMLGLTVQTQTNVNTDTVSTDLAGTTNNSIFVVNNDDSLAFNVSTATSAQNVLSCIDKYIGAIDSKRAELGAVQNRLESTIRNQSNISQNLSDARSQIRDTDFATETANMTQTSIIQQASQSILTQANQRPQMAIQLLQG